MSPTHTDDRPSDSAATASSRIPRTSHGERVVKVSQLDLALRAGTTQRHLSFLESGRSAPGRTLVVRLAESLELPLRERNELLAAAGYAPVYPQTPLEDLTAVRTALRHVLAGHEPYPAVVVDRYGTLVDANRAPSRCTSRPGAGSST
nr:helix-turn-helix transcriptional regulator [Cryptosporangium phraense]